MANQTARKTETPNPERKSERFAEAHRGRRVSEASAVPPDADAEASGHSPVPRSEPPKTYIVNSDHEAYVIDPDGEVRAGPGDAGRQDRPERLPESADRAPQSVRRLMTVLGIAAVVAIVLYAVLL